MSKTDITRRKERLYNQEKKLKKKIQTGTDSVEKDVSKALKAGLIIGGVLFAGYQITRLFTSSKKTEPQKKKVLSKL